MKSDGPPPIAMGGSTAPASMPPMKEGQAMEGRVIMDAVVTALEKTLPLFGSTSNEGQAILKALESFKIFGPASPDLSQAQAKKIGLGAPPIQMPGAAQQSQPSGPPPLAAAA